MTTSLIGRGLDSDCTFVNGANDVDSSNNNIIIIVIIIIISIVLMIIITVMITILNKIVCVIPCKSS